MLKRFKLLLQSWVSWLAFWKFPAIYIFFFYPFLWEDPDDHYLLCQRLGCLRGTVEHAHILNFIFWIKLLRDRQQVTLQDYILKEQNNCYHTNKKIPTLSFAEWQAFSDRMENTEKHSPSGRAWQTSSIKKRKLKIKKP